MAGEKELQQTLDVGDVIIHEIGVFPAPPFAGEPQGDVEGPERDVESMSPELTTLIGLGRDLAAANRVGTALPAGRAGRLHADPRVLILEDIPPPEATAGPVTRIDDRSWAVDGRGDQAAALVIEANGHRVALWTAHGEVRMFELRSPR